MTNTKIIFGIAALVALFALTAWKPTPQLTSSALPERRNAAENKKNETKLFAPLPELPIEAPKNPGETQIVRGEGQNVVLPDDTLVEDIVAIGAQGDILIRDERGYQLVYLRSYNRYLVWISGKPFDSLRARAEDDFLQTVSAGSKIDACSKDVRVVPAPYTYPGQPARSLSFC